MDYIAGYVIFNDITARDIQRREMRVGVFSFCKAIDTFCPLGPWIVTPDEVARPARPRDGRCASTARRARRRTRATCRSTIPEIISHYSRARATRAGDVLSTGTVTGVAGFSEDAASLYLKPGDVIEAEIERIGVLRNPVISWQDGARTTRASARPLVESRRGCEAKGVHHRDHGPGRLVSRGDPAREGLRGVRHGPALELVQHRPGRPHLRATSSWCSAISPTARC